MTSTMAKEGAWGTWDSKAYECGGEEGQVDPRMLSTPVHTRALVCLWPWASRGQHQAVLEMPQVWHVHGLQSSDVARMVAWVAHLKGVP